VAAYDNAEWDALVAAAVKSGSLPLPADLVMLYAANDIVRGPEGDAARVQPAGKVVDDVRPRFSWPARDGATYTVFIFDGPREIVRSRALRETQWTPERALPRGRLLTWQVEAARGDLVETLPHPPAPPASLRIASERDHRDLDHARQRYGDDDLLLGVLYARAGMLDESAAALRRAVRTHPEAVTLLRRLPYIP
jgi:hypothetical protein